MADTPGMALLEHAAQGDELRLEAMKRRVEAGEPAAYVAGWMSFAGRWFKADQRAYITDPELIHLLELVRSEGDRIAPKHRPLRVLEFGIGAGTLAITLKLERSGWALSGLDIDLPALQLAAENAKFHQVEIELLHSDFLDGWGDREPPDLLFADPPWGDERDLYDNERDAAYYHAMPAASAYPSNGRTGIHDELLRRLVAARWPSLIVLNYGILPLSEIERSGAALADYRLQPISTPSGDTVHVLIGRAV